MATALLTWFDHAGRHDLPWQHPRTPYRVWVSEIMLQQTRVSTVIPYFSAFMTALPTLPALAAATEDQVLALWSGLGYYRRARHLHAAARACVQRHQGHLPTDLAALCALPGIGRSTAGAILAQAHGQRMPILDGNVKRVLTRFHGIHGHPGQSAVENQLWQLATEHTPASRVADYTQAIMDLGATVCTRSQPDCAACPLAPDCVARRENLTAILPTRAPRRTLPTRHTHMLIVREEAHGIVLCKRPPEGVWPGLWSLPEAADQDAAQQLASAFGHVRQADPLPEFTHVFSHFRLHVTPRLYVLEQTHAGVSEDASQRWCQPGDLATMGLPAPVRKLLQTLVPTPRA